MFIESLIFIFISLVGLRGRLIELVPKHIMLVRAGGVNGTRRTAEHVGCFAFGRAFWCSSNKWYLCNSRWRHVCEPWHFLHSNTCCPLFFPLFPPSPPDPPLPSFLIWVYGNAGNCSGHWALPGAYWCASVAYQATDCTSSTTAHTTHPLSSHKSLLRFLC